MQTPETTVCEGGAGPSWAGPFANKTSGDKAIVGAKHGSRSRGTEKSEQREIVPAGTRKKCLHNTLPLAPPTSSAIPNPRKSPKRKASTDKVASSVEDSAPSSPADGIEKVSRKKAAKQARRQSKTEDEGPIVNPENNSSLDNAVEKEQDESINKKCVNDPETFFGQWCKHREYAMCITVEKISTTPGKSNESTVENPFIADGYILTGIAVYWGENEARYLRLDNVDPGKLKEQLGPENRVIVPDVHRALNFLARPCNLNPAKCGWEEPTLANWLLDPDNRKAGIPDLVKKWVPNAINLFEDEVTGVQSTSDSDRSEEQTNSKNERRRKVRPEMKKNADAWERNEVSDEVACRQAVVLWKLQKALAKQLGEKKMDKLYREHLVPVLGLHSKMVLNGLGYDPDNVLDAVSSAMKDLEKDFKNDFTKFIDDWAEEEYDLTKPKDVKIIVDKFVEKLKMNRTLLKKRLTDDILTKMSQELRRRSLPDFPAKIRDFRKMKRIENRLKDIRKKSVEKLECEQDNGNNQLLIYSLGQTWTVTGRIFPGDPNLQFIQKNIKVCTEPVKTIIKARAAFKPSEGAVFLSADYSQLELQILAHLSEDEALREVFKKKEDVFRTMAVKWNICREEDFNDKIRSQTKQIAYGILYGRGYKSIANELGIKEEEAKNMITMFKKAFPGVDDHKQRLLDNARKSKPCAVSTLLRRRRLLPNLNSQDNQKKAQAQRQVLNTVVQGSAADVFWTALLAMDKALGQEHLRPRPQKEGGTYMVLQLHDEVLLEVREDAFDEVSKIVRNCMEGVKKTLGLSVPFPVRMRKGDTWGDMEDI